MTAAYLALQGFVKSPLHFPQRWGAMMGKIDASKWTPVLISGITLVVLLTQIGFGANGVFHDQAKDVQAVQAQVAVLQTQTSEMKNQINTMQSQMATLLSVPGLIQRLTDRLDAGPRTDLLTSQYNEIQRHLSALDGRSDTSERQQRADEDRAIEGLAQTRARLDAIENASKATLGNHR